MMISSKAANVFLESVYKFVETFTGKSLDLPFKKIEEQASINEALEGLAENFEVMTAAVNKAKSIKFTVEELKVLEPGKIYAVEVDFKERNDVKWRDWLFEVSKLLDLQFLIFPKGLMKPINAPEGIEIIQK